MSNFIQYWNENSIDLLFYTEQHIEMVLIALAAAVVLAIAIIVVSVSHKKWQSALVYFFSILYSVPSFAFFALLIPVTGLGYVTAIIVLALYAEYVLLRSFITGLNDIDPQIIEASRGMGMTERQIFWKVQLPLARHSIFSGITVAMTSMMAIATIGATINAGGLGTVLFSGLRTQNMSALLWGTLLTVLLTLGSTLMLWILECITKPKFERI